MTLELRKKKGESLGPFSFFMAHMENFGEDAGGAIQEEPATADDIVDDIDIDSQQWFHGRRSSKKISEGES
jgi:hypothetical protein